MKRLFVAASVLGLTVSALAQGLIALDNDASPSTATPTSTSGGLFFIPGPAGVAKIHGDFNAAFYGGTDSANLTLIASFSGAAAVGSSSFGDGTWTDPNGKTYTVPGLENAAATGAPIGASATFSSPWASLPNLTPDLTGMPEVCICYNLSLALSL